MTRKSEYLIDNLRSEISALQTELKTLQDECKFGAAVSFVSGLVIGAAIAGVVAWL